MPRRRGRYLGILRGGNINARNQLISYFQGDRTVEYPERQGNRPARQEVFVRLFGIPLEGANQLVQEVNSTRFAGVQSFVNGFTASSLAVDSQIRARGLLAPRASFTTGRSQTGTRRTSQLTGLTYLDYGGDTVVVPFGPGTSAGQDDETEVFNIIRGRADAAPGDIVTTFIPGSTSL
jgi:hypothetical protein